MVRGIVSGLVWGGVVASAGLAVISQIAPLPPRGTDSPLQSEVTGTEAPSEQSDASGDPVSAPETTSGPVTAAEGQTPPSEAEPASPAGDTTEAAATPLDPATEPVVAKAPDAVDPTAPDAPKAPAAPGLPDASVAMAENAPDTPLPPSTGDTPAAADPMPPQVGLPPPPPPPALDDALIAPLPQNEAAPDDLATPATDGAVAEEVETEPSRLADAETDEPQPAPLPQIAGDGATPADPQAPAPAQPDAPLSDAPLSDALAPDVPALPGEPADALPASDPSVATDRLPRIGNDEPLPEVEVIAEQEAPLRPIDAFARPFDNPDGKPLFAILLADDGAPDLDRDTLAALPFPVTFVVDPLAEGAAAAAAVYRAGLKEVVFAASGLPQGATPADVEQAFQSHALALPETVAAIDLPRGGFQDSRTIAGTVLPILAEQGRGLLTYDRGLNAADQIARREGIPAATVFRILDGDGESAPTIRRYLDRAAFRAAQEGEVVVIGSTRPETVAALLEWTVEGRAASVALAPVSAVLMRN